MRSGLTPEQVDFLRAFESRVDLDGTAWSGHVSATRRRPATSAIITPRRPDDVVSGALAETEGRRDRCGHTHHQFDRTWKAGRFVNAGSVGMAYADQPGATGRWSAPTSSRAGRL